jgi:hypothetical protein
VFCFYWWVFENLVFCFLFFWGGGGGGGVATFSTYLDYRNLKFYYALFVLFRNPIRLFLSLGFNVK